MAVDLDAANRAALRAFGVRRQTGKKWTYVPRNGPSFDIDGIFDEAWATLGVQGVGRGALMPLSTTAPALWIRLLDLAQDFKPKQDDALRNNVTQQTYSIADTLLDGQGGMRLILNETT